MLSEVEYVKSLPAIRQRCSLVFEAAKDGGLNHFTLNLARLPVVVEYIVDLIGRTYGPVDTDEIRATVKKIPPHGRWSHFGNENVQNFMSGFPNSQEGKWETARAMIDLFVVGTLMDAGAGDQWKYVDAISGKISSRSEGLAVASLRMIEAGRLSSNGAEKRVDSIGLRKLTREAFEEAFQVCKTNPLVGVEGRFEMLQRLSILLEQGPKYFPPIEGLARPAGMIEYLQSQVDPVTDSVPIEKFWELIVGGFGPVWPGGRTVLEGKLLGDVWPCDALGGVLVPFHKLSQWLSYSLFRPLKELAGLNVSGIENMTGLSEYRNGGLFVDLGVISLKESSRLAGIENAKSLGVTDQNVPIFAPDHQAIIEWRALTLVLIDIVAKELRSRFDLTEKELPLPAVLEAGTWKGGRAIAFELRAHSGGPPIAILSDGTLF